MTPETSLQRRKGRPPPANNERRSRTTCSLALLFLIAVASCSPSRRLLVLPATGAPLHLVADFSTFAFSILANQQQQQQQHTHQSEPMHLELGEQVAAAANIFRAASSSGASSTDDEDPDEMAADEAAARAAAAGGVSPNETTLAASPADSNFSSLLKSDFGANQDDDEELVQSLNETKATASSTTTVASVDAVQGKQQVPMSSGTAKPMRTGPGVTGGHFIYLPNGQSVQFGCDKSKGSGCLDENAVCKLGTCVCKPGFFQTRTSSACQSVSDLLKNCENDLQCQAFNVDLICDNKSHERPFCDCTPGLYFDHETHTCLPCHRNTIILTAVANVNQSDEPTGATIAANGSDAAEWQATANSSATTNSLPPPVGVATALQSGTATTSTGLKPCRPADISKLKFKQKLFGLLPGFSAQYDDSGERLQVLANGVARTTTGPGSPTISAHPHSPHTSDPFRIKTPIEVFIGAIMLFTLFTVAWFFLQRIIHDCRTIIKSIRAGPDSLSGCDPNFTGAFATATTTHMPVGEHPLDVTAMGHHHHLSPGGPNSAASSLAAARFAASLASGTDADYVETSPGFFARRRSANGQGFGYMATTLAGAYHRSLAAGLMAAASVTNSTSTTTSLSSSHQVTPLATAVTNSGQSSAATRSAITRLVGDDTDDELMASIYPFIETPNSYHGGARELARTAGAGLDHHHPGLAILRVAMTAQSRLANYPAGCMPINYLNPAFEPPPKYEEAIAQGAHQQPIYLQQQINTPTSPNLLREASSADTSQQATNTITIDESVLDRDSHQTEQGHDNQMRQQVSSTATPTVAQSSQSGVSSESNLNNEGARAANNGERTNSDNKDNNNTNDENHGEENGT
jgi:hypothetical protein